MAKKANFDFTLLEKELYGDVETDTALLNELSELIYDKTPQMSNAQELASKSLAFTATVKQDFAVDTDDDDPSVENDSLLLDELDELMGSSKTGEQNSTTPEKIESSEEIPKSRLAEKPAQSTMSADKPDNVKESIPSQPEIPPSTSSVQVLPKKIDSQKSDESPQQSLPSQSSGSIGDRSTSANYDRAASVITELNRVCDYCKKFAMEAKTAGDDASALEYCKMFKSLKDQYANDPTKDLSPVKSLVSELTQKVKLAQSSPEKSNLSAAPVADEQVKNLGNSQAQSSLTKADTRAMPVASFRNDLQQELLKRLEKFKETAERAAAEGNASKVRRMNRIQKQYEDAIRNVQRGRPVNFSELPNPPCFPPLPSSDTTGNSADPLVAETAVKASSGSPKREPTVQKVTPEHPDIPKPANNAETSSETPSAPPIVPHSSQQEKQLDTLTRRYEQFRSLALESKKQGDLKSAKAYLRNALGIKQLMEASENGFPINMTSVPKPPVMQPKRSPNQRTGSLKSNDNGTVLVETAEEAFTMLEKDLIHQIQFCELNREYYKRLGDVHRCNDFKLLRDNCAKDLLCLRNTMEYRHTTPRFHYETRVFPSLKCSPDLKADQMELIIICCKNVLLPPDYDERKHADLFVRYIFPCPKDQPQTGKTESVRYTCSPDFNHSAKLRIVPRSRGLLFYIKRHGIKFDVYQKGSLIRSDKLLGSAELKLLPLEKENAIHDSVKLILNKKDTGGTIEVKVRIREPLVEQESETSKRWLIIDEFIQRTKIAR
ncbi:unnamed protein product [Soboliphyme baturini]|uniref:C2 domain-containing protein n=1 Tax=Soboliphyme baturini TaxID=241478 RepID=A0A183IVA0_9BILA|nr:unnamed protein product [Soboliphyme baturini]